MFSVKINYFTEFGEKRRTYPSSLPSVSRSVKEIAMAAYLLEVNLAAFSCYIINDCQPTV